MKNRIKNYLGNKLLDLVDLIFANKPEGEKYTQKDREQMRESKRMREWFK